MKGGDIGNNMIAGHDEEQLLGGASSDGERDGRRSIARLRFDEQAQGFVASLLARDVDMARSADDERFGIACADNA